MILVVDDYDGRVLPRRLPDVALIIFPVLDSAKGGGEGMVPPFVGSGLLLAAAGAPGSNETGVVTAHAFLLR